MMQPAFVAPSLLRAPRRRRPRPSTSSTAPVCTASKSPSPSSALTTTVAATLAAATLLITPPSALSASYLLDYDHILTTGQTARVESRLRSLEESGLSVRVLTQNEATAPGRSVARLLDLSDSTALIIMDRRGGNILNFNVGAALRDRLPPSFWNELSNRYGNEFYIRDNGPDQALFATLEKIEACSSPLKVCRVVPGISDDQLYVSAASAAVAGCIAGAAVRTGGKRYNFKYLALYSPLWAIFFFSFGIAPVITRVDGLSIELAKVIAPFLITASAVWAWVPARFGKPGESDPSEQ